jgi:DNA-binding HxlR family transcriptional regulator
LKPPTICPRFEKTISLLSQIWTALVIYELLSWSGRFGEIQPSIGISGKVLSERLKELEHKEIVKREVIPETPVIIEYSLTAV